MKNWMKLTIKFAVVGLLITWLVKSGRLDFSQLKIFVDEPSILMMSIAVWLFCYMGLGTARWSMLLKGQGIEVPFWRVFCLQLIGAFFNTAAPGAVGGDVIKAVVLLRERSGNQRAATVLTVFLDRVIGLACLFVLAGMAVFFRLEVFMLDPRLKPLAAFLGVGFVLLLVGVGVVFFPHKDGADPVEKLLSMRVVGFSSLLKLYRALRLYRQRPWALVWALLISCVIQTCAFFYTLSVTAALTGQNPSVEIFAPVYAIGVMTTAIPLAPGGLGVGHMAFDRLFHMVGLDGGANVFNVTVLAQLALNLTGFWSYLMYRSKVPSDLTQIEVPE